MRIVAGLALVTGLVGCGRIGYDPVTDSPLDAPDDELDGPPSACGAPVMLVDLEDSASPAPATYVLDATETSTGFVVAWSAGHGRVETAGVAIDGAGRIAVLQSHSTLYELEATAISTAAVGDRVLVAADDGSSIQLAPLDHLGYERGSMKTIDDVRGVGHDFMAVKPSAEGIVVLGGAATSTAAFTRDLDAHPITGPDQVFARATAGSGAAAVAGGYVMLSRQPAGAENCDVVPVDTSIVATAASQEIVMTCNHASVSGAAEGAKALAAWNGTNDAVWIAGGPVGALPSSPRAVYQGDAATSASDPRLAVKGNDYYFWYSYRVAGTRLGYAIVDADGAELRAPQVVHTAPDLVAYDLISHGDKGYLIWLEAGTRDQLWLMPICE
ncbi:MAG TPA: hypothetical protein VM734_16945 [Kofleriaceae bacterium]|nr:hypothetical protein [Kofleriaceae bacterium]